VIYPLSTEYELTFPICSLSEYGYGFLDGTP
jgi:hypothetical protein